MDFSDFRSRAIAEGKRYGKDEYVFVREFAQNARDAGAGRISLSTVFHEDENPDTGSLEITFTDDGSGMAFEHARRYLFTLYASSKEKEAASAGQFGVGFWSILLFSPRRILIFSRTNKENWGVEFNQMLDRERSIRSPLEARGTRVVACKNLTRDQANQCISGIERSLRRYCRFLRRNNRRASPLEVRFNGARIDGPMILDGECAATFAYRDVQGAVALGRSPQVSLHVRGLPVWSGTSLSELQYGAAPELPVSYPSGLAPVYLLNGNRLSVTLDRRSVFDDAALQQTRRVAGREMRKLVAGYLDQIAPPGILGRLEYFLSGLSEDFQYHFSRRLLPLWPILAAVLVLGGVGWVLFPGMMGSLYEAAVTDDESTLPDIPPYLVGATLAGDYEQATTENGVKDVLEMHYTPENESWYFRIQTVEQLHKGSGAKSGRLTPYRFPADYHCPRDCLNISVMLDSDNGVYYLPVPTGYYIDKNTVQYPDGVEGELVRSSKDDWLFVQRYHHGSVVPVIRYRAGPVTSTLTAPDRFLGYPRIRLPAAYREALETAQSFDSVERRVTMLTGLVEQSIAYDTSANTVEQYRAFFDSGEGRSWYEFVFTLNKGDCDVKNIILIHLLRQLNIPSRLAVGYVGKNGHAEAGKHAWVEYFYNGWKQADATGQALRDTANGADGNDEPAPETSDSPQRTIDERLPSLVSRAPMNQSKSNKEADSEFTGPHITSTFLIWTSTALMLVILFIVVVLLRRALKVKPPSPTDSQEKLAAQMLQAVLENEKMKIRGSALFSRPLIPTWNATRITMNRAKKLAERKMLFYSASESSFVERLVQHGYIVVTTEKRTFAPVVSRLWGSLNIDEVVSLRPIIINESNREETLAYRVFFEMMSICESFGLHPNLLVPCRGLFGMMFREYELASVSVLWRQNVPGQFIAVSVADSENWNSMISLGGSIHDAAVLLLDRIAAKASVFDEVRDEFRIALAQTESTRAGETLK